MIWLCLFELQWCRLHEDTLSCICVHWWRGRIVVCIYINASNGKNVFLWLQLHRNIDLRCFISINLSWKQKFLYVSTIFFPLITTVFMLFLCSQKECMASPTEYLTMSNFKFSLEVCQAFTTKFFLVLQLTFCLFL